jgi:hypothetical protein
MVTCPGCSTQAFLECSCPAGFIDAVGAHHGDCTHSDIDANLICPPGSECCSLSHDHAAAANSCPGTHGDAPCPEPPGECATWKGAIADAFHPEFTPGSHPLFSGKDIPACPGGHCHKDVKDCTVCRPLVITVLPGTQIAPVGR